MSQDDEGGYIALAQDPKTTAADLVGYAHSKGFAVRPQDAQAFISKRGAVGTARVGSNVTYSAAHGLPQPPPSASRPADASPSLGRSLSGRPGVMNRLDDRFEAESQAHRTFAEAVNAAKPQQRAELDAGLAGPALQTAGHIATGNIPGFVAGLLQRGLPAGMSRFRNDVRDRIAEVMTATHPADMQSLLAAVEQRARTDQQFQRRLARAGITVGKLQAIHAAGQDAEPMHFETEDGRVLVGTHNDEPLYGPAGMHYPPSH